VQAVVATDDVLCTVHGAVQQQGCQNVLALLMFLVLLEPASRYVSHLVFALGRVWQQVGRKSSTAGALDDPLPLSGQRVGGLWKTI
jgi:hypothetical protein